MRRTCLPEDLRLRSATRSDDRFLYALLIERYERPDTNIEGQAAARLPTFEEHVRHLDGAPYPALDVVVLEGEDVGIVYLNRARAVGCFVLRAHAGRGIGLAACHAFISKCELPVYAHVHPRNRSARRTTERLGFLETEVLPHRIGYELREPPRDAFGAVRLRRAAQAPPTERRIS